MKKKLILKKVTIANLSAADLNQVRGGNTWSQAADGYPTCYDKGTTAKGNSRLMSCESGLKACP